MGLPLLPFRSGCCLRSFASVCHLLHHKSCFPYLFILWLQSCSLSSCHLILRSGCSSSSFEWNHTHRAINLTSPVKPCSPVNIGCFHTNISIQNWPILIFLLPISTKSLDCSVVLTLVCPVQDCIQPWSCSESPCHLLPTCPGGPWWMEGLRDTWPWISPQKRHPQQTSRHSSIGAWSWHVS